MQKVNLDDLQGPAYIGWVPSGLIVTLGAEYPPTTILRSLFRETHYKYIPTGFEVQGAVQANPVPFVSGLFSFTKSYNKSDLRIRFAPMDNVAALVDQLYSKNVILYDQGSELALLCPLINLVVSLVKGYLRANKYKYSQKLLEFDIPKSQSGIREVQGVKIANDFTVGDAFKIIAFRYSASNASLPSHVRTSKSNIYAFEFADIMGNNDDFFARKLSIKGKRGVESW
jgi:hypothetical protein